MAFVAAVTAVGLWFARHRTRERIAESHREADLLAAHATDLARHSLELDQARRNAERALAMAEETNLVRTQTGAVALVDGLEVWRIGTQ